MKKTTAKYEYVLFDLDGTLTDPALGITNSVMYALKKFGISVSDRSELFRFIGPPLMYSFKTYYGFDDEKAKLALDYYRDRFADGGKFARRLVVRELVALERRRRGFRRVRHVVGIAQVLLHFHSTLRDLLLSLSQTVLALVAAPVLDEVEPVRARVARAMVLGRGDAVKAGQGARQRRSRDEAEAERDAVWEKRFHVYWLLLTLPQALS